MGELVDLQGYGEAGLIPESDLELREAAGLPEFPESTMNVLGFTFTTALTSEDFDNLLRTFGTQICEHIAKTFGAIGQESYSLLPLEKKDYYEWGESAILMQGGIEEALERNLTKRFAPISV